MCIFCDIADKKIPSDVIFEDDAVMAFSNIEPKSPVHILVIPKRHIDSTKTLKEEDEELVGKLVLAARNIAKEKGISESGYRLILNTGRDAGQTVDHLHLHLMGGEKLPFA
ncbi:MAG: histidine triad nucleotide-binding protein [Candidatus Paceibacterota bacterium]|jgi:histidine triad (HIT) family protein